MEQPLVNKYPADSALELRYLLTQAISNAFELSEQTALPLADRISNELFTLAGGDSLYIPRVDRRQRDEAIRDEFNGENREVICERYKISIRQFYRIVG